jgi:pyrroline-5-carboxylate reductase
MGDAVEAGAVVISIAAGIRTATIEASVPAGVSVVRAMPNTPARIGQGVTGISAGSQCTPEALALAQLLLESVGLVVTVPEDLQDAVTAVSGSGPAYLFYLAEAMTAAGVELGLDLEVARQMVNRTLLGASMLLDTSGESAAELRRRVTSPGGTTASAIATLGDRAVDESVVAALTAARDRSRELSGA